MSSQNSSNQAPANNQARPNVGLKKLQAPTSAQRPLFNYQDGDDSLTESSVDFSDYESDEEENSAEPESTQGEKEVDIERLEENMTTCKLS